jgi:hypothetical protein
MTFGRYLAGMALVAIAVLPLVVAAVRLRRRLLPEWDGAPARLAESVIAIALLLGVAQVLGAVGLFYPVPMALASALCGGAIIVLVAAPAAGESESRQAPRVDRFGLVLGMLAAAVVVGQWGVDTVEAYDRGMYGSDTLRYHGPVAARFVQEHSIVGLHFLIDDPVVTFHPYNAELLHAIGMLFMGTDVLSPLINLGWLAIALLAAWCIGRPSGHSPATLLAAALVLASPALVQTQPGTVDNDIVGLALVLAAAALMLCGGFRLSALAVAGIAGGLAIGTKLTTVGIVGAMTIGLIAAAPRLARRRVAAAWTLPLVAAGFYWYARNLFAVGNPLPWFAFDLGPLSLPSPPQLQGLRVSHYLTDSHLWKDVFFPGLRDRFGTVWPVVFGLGLAGMALSVWRGPTRIHKVLGAAAAVGLLEYLLTPGTAAGPEGFPIFFSATARYVAPSMVLGLVLLPLVPGVDRFAQRRWFLAGLAVLLAATLSNQGVEPLDASRAGFALACLALLAGLAWIDTGRTALPRWAAAAALLGVCFVLAGWRVADSYLADRYARGELSWAKEIRDSRIALVGSMRQYHLYGDDLSNRVQYVGREGPHGAYARIGGCAEWRRALDAGGYGYVAVTPANELFGSYSRRRPPEVAWTRDAPGATVLLREPKGLTVFRLDGKLGTAGCPRRLVIR